MQVLVLHGSQAHVDEYLNNFAQRAREEGWGWHTGDTFEGGSDDGSGSSEGVGVAGTSRLGGL